MDIDYLLALQDFRGNTGDALTPFMEGLSLFAVTFLIMLPVFVYWVIDKKKGLYTLVSYYLCCGVNAMVKLTACVYRPWIKDARVLPAGDADGLFLPQRPYRHRRAHLRRTGGNELAVEKARGSGLPPARLAHGVFPELPGSPYAAGRDGGPAGIRAGADRRCEDLQIPGKASRKGKPVPADQLRGGLPGHRVYHI